MSAKRSAASEELRAIKREINRHSSRCDCEDATRCVQNIKRFIAERKAR